MWVPSVGGSGGATRAPLCVADGLANHLGRWAPRAFGVGIVEHARPWVDMWLPSMEGRGGAGAETTFDVVPALTHRATTWWPVDGPLSESGLSAAGLRPPLAGVTGPLPGPARMGFVVAGLTTVNAHCAPCGRYARRGASAPRQHQRTSKPRPRRGAM
jgi:hypothetical protein